MLSERAPRGMQRSISAASATSTMSQQSVEDWDRSQIDISHLSLPPSRSPTQITQTTTQESSTPVTAVKVHRNPSPYNVSASRALADLLRAYAKTGRGIELTEVEEGRLADELARWINSNSSPYELDDDDFYFATRSSSEVLASTLPRFFASTEGVAPPSGRAIPATTCPERHTTSVSTGYKRDAGQESKQG